ncbi:uncharacterized protein C4orf45 [Aplysia californica]|uniref:Uncharacterized protein C4orf45 n=1 Tax=Aplysia californica TaxID=6500 RepID=A0ABM1A2N2_APLCA|nr:uncharacterized protein C4orf45 [Aplysia californica]
MDTNEPRENFTQYYLKRDYLEQENCPDGLRDYRPHMITDPHQVGVGDQSTEHSGDVAYVFRPAPGTPMPRPRSCIPGEIGWGIPTLTDWATPNTGQQIMLGNFRQIAEDRSTHENMNPWYPGPKECTPAGSPGYYRENIYSGRPGAEQPVVTTFSKECPDSSQGVCENPGVYSRGRFRPLEATQHGGIHRSC